MGIVQTEAPGLYKYYSTQRPVDIGTFPKPPHNAPDEMCIRDRAKMAAASARVMLRLGPKVPSV